MLNAYLCYMYKEYQHVFKNIRYSVTQIPTNLRLTARNIKYLYILIQLFDAELQVEYFPLPYIHFTLKFVKLYVGTVYKKIISQKIFSFHFVNCIWQLSLINYRVGLSVFLTWVLCVQSWSLLLLPKLLTKYSRDNRQLTCILFVSDACKHRRLHIRNCPYSSKG